MKRVWPLHPLLFTLFPVLSLYTDNIAEAPLTDLIRPLAAGGVLLAAAWVLAWAATRSGAKAALMASLVVSLFFAFGQIAWIFVGLFNGMLPPRLLNDIFAGIWTVVVLAGLVGLSRIRRAETLDNTTRVLNFMGVVLVILPLWTGVTGTLRLRAERAKQASAPPSVTDGTSNPAPQTPPRPGDPDIYYVILDAYGRDDTLKSRFGFDNAPFLEALRERGFTVARNSRSNYNQTILALPSSLNMTYLDRLAAQVGDTAMLVDPLADAIRDNAAARFLRRRGYRTVAIEAGTGGPEDGVRSRQFLAGRIEISPFEVGVIANTPFGFLPISQDSMYLLHRTGLLKGFEHYAEQGQDTDPTPKFVYVHILAPHPPFVFGPNGEPVQSNSPFNNGDGDAFFMMGRTRDEYRRGYPAQAQYVNQRFLAATDAVLAGAARTGRPSPVIVVQGDHGSRMGLVWGSLERSDLEEMFSNLSAFRIPGKKPSAVYDTISNVNTFPALFNTLFDAKLPLLPDRSYFSSARERYRFIDVTDRLKKRDL